MVGALVQVMRQRGIQGDWPAPWAVRGKTAQQPDHRVLVIQQLWRGWGHHGRKHKDKEREEGETMRGALTGTSITGKWSHSAPRGAKREAEMVGATGHLLQGRRLLASRSESKRRG